MEVQHSPQVQESRRPVVDPVFPAVRNEFYSYRQMFSEESPIGYLMKCRANKGRPMGHVEYIDEQIDLVFFFDGQITVCSPRAQRSERLLDGILSDSNKLGRTTLSAFYMKPEEFYRIRSSQDGQGLAQICRASQLQRHSLTLSVDTVFAAMTESGKYGLFLVKELTSSSITVDACHILL